MLRFFGFLCKWAIIAAIWGGVLLTMVIFYYYHDLPNLEDMENANSKQVIEVCYSNGNRITTLGDLYANQITFNQIPNHLIEAVVATEDRKFFSHGGVDFLGILRAAYVNYRADKIVQGGSTITQQLAKMMFLKPDRTIKRKVQELMLAWQLEQTFSKEQILTLYLNRAYFGSGNYGIASASRYYFSKPVAKLNLNESAMLAGLLKAPSKLSPNNNQKLAEKRTTQVLENMVDAGYLNDNNIDEIKKPIVYKDDKLQRFYFSDYVASQFTGYLSKGEQINNNRFSIVTTLDEKLQKIVEDEANNFVKQNGKKLGNGANEAELAMILMSPDGELLAMVGGRDYQKSPFNRAVYAKRQAGSAFKLFVYLTALQNGFKPDDIMEDKKVSLGGWSPENYEKQYYGQVTLKQAFAKSLNSVAVQLTAKLDKKEIIKNALKMGIISEVNNQDATLALGTAQVSLLELVNSYGAIANDGVAIFPYSVKKIFGNKDKILYQKQVDKSYQIIAPEDVGEMKEMLREVVETGTGKAANVADNIYGKTGTSQNYRDAWFIGFNDKYILGVWIGNDNNKPTNKITGGTLPAELFANVMKKIN